MNTLNDGSRPSRLAMARALTGEDPFIVVDPAFARSIPSTVPTFDFAALCARAADIPSDDPLLPPPEEDMRPASARIPGRTDPWRTILRKGGIAASMVVGARLAITGAVAGLTALAVFVLGPTDEGRLKGGESDLQFYVRRGSDVFPGEPSSPVQPGDGIQFTYRTTEDRLVLLSVDAEGVVSVFWPAQGDEAVEVVPGERHVLEPSVTLDDAPSPEVFVGFFGDWTVTEAKARAREAYRVEGIDGVADLGDPKGDDDIATITLEKLD